MKNFVPITNTFIQLQGMIKLLKDDTFLFSRKESKEWDVITDPTLHHFKLQLAVKY